MPGWLAPCGAVVAGGVMAGQPEFVKSLISQGHFNQVSFDAACIHSVGLSVPVKPIGRGKPPPFHCGCGGALFAFTSLCALTCS